MLPVAGTCRLCLVEVKNRGKLIPACGNLVEEGMEIHTDTEKTTESGTDSIQVTKRCAFHHQVFLTRDFFQSKIQFGSFEMQTS